MLPECHKEAITDYEPRLEGFHKAMCAVKDAIRIEDYAGELTRLYCNGHSLRGACPVHDGENRSSFAVYPEQQRWVCFGCNEGGDVVDLCQHVEKHSQLWTAMLSLARRYNIEPPTRPASWYRRQGEKAKVCQAVLEALTRSYQRRLFSVFGDVILEGVEDEEEREEEARKLFEDFHRVARIAAKNRMERRHD